MHTRAILMTLLLLPAALLLACTGEEVAETEETELVEVASSPRQWTGVAVAPDERIFVNYPRWNPDVPFSVGELQVDGDVRPFPDSAWNRWRPGFSPESVFVCVQAVYVDKYGFLWILDPANPMFRGVVPGGPKLVKIDLGTNKVIQTIYFDSTVAPPNSYLNDVRIDADRGYAYISESGAGALIVTDLGTGYSRRLLDDHPSIKSEGLTVTINDKEWRRPDGSRPEVHCDGIALDSTGEYIYYQALTAKTLYRIATEHLRNLDLSPEQLASHVEVVAETEPVDGIMFDPRGYLYLSALQSKAIKRLTPEGEIELVVADERIRWPDTFAYGPNGFVYFTTSQIHLTPDPETPFQILKFLPPPPEEPNRP